MNTYYLIINVIEDNTREIYRTVSFCGLLL